jgi:hypothetical protein
VQATLAEYRALRLLNATPVPHDPAVVDDAVAPTEELVTIQEDADEALAKELRRIQAAADREMDQVRQKAETRRLAAVKAAEETDAKRLAAVQAAEEAEAKRLAAVQAAEQEAEVAAVQAAEQAAEAK